MRHNKTKLLAPSVTSGNRFPSVGKYYYYPQLMASGNISLTLWKQYTTIDWQ